MDDPPLGSIVSMFALVLLIMMLAVPSGPTSPSFFFYGACFCFLSSLTEGTGGCFSLMKSSSFLRTGGSLAWLLGTGFAFAFTSAGSSYFGLGGGLLEEPNACFGPVSTFLVPVN